MRRHLITLIVAMFVAGLFSLPSAGAAPGPTCVIRDENGICTLYASDPGQGGGTSSTPVGSTSGGGGPAVCRDGTGAKIACSYKGAWWSADKGCYVQAATPQPPKSDPAWGGQTTGAIYECLPGMGRAGFQNIPRFWLATAPGTPAVDPVQVARSAVAKMGLRAITVGIVPEPGPNSIGLVGLPVWMWVAQPGPQTVGPQTANATAGTVTVTATATLSSIVWDMGDGHTVSCTGTGTPYEDRDGARMSPDCGYRYQKVSAHQPGGVYAVTATSYWTVTWTGGGQQGTIPLHFTATTQIRVGQAEAIVTG